MNDKIRDFALRHVGMTAEEYKVIQRHEGQTCPCDGCAKFERYMAVRAVIEAWEKDKKC